MRLLLKHSPSAQPRLLLSSSLAPMSHYRLLPLLPLVRRASLGSSKGQTTSKSAALSATSGLVSGAGASQQKQKQKQLYHGGLTESNQFVGLICALLSVRAWDQARFLLNLLEAHSIDPLGLMLCSPRLRDSLAALVLWYLQDLQITGQVSPRRYCLSLRLASASASADDQQVATAQGKSSACAVGLSPPPKKDTSSSSSAATPAAANAGGRNEVTIPVEDWERASVTAAAPCTARAAAIEQVPTMTLPQLQRPSTSAEDFPVVIAPLLSYLGYHVHAYPDLVDLLCRLGRQHVQTLNSRYSVHVDNDAGIPADSTVAGTATATANGSSNNSSSFGGACEGGRCSRNKHASVASPTHYRGVVGLLANTLLPALTVSTENSAFLSASIWRLLSLLPFSVRFAVYDLWKGAGVAKDGLNHKHMQVVLAETVALHAARAEIKRLAKENVSKVGKKVSKFTHCAPIVVFNHVLGQVEAFDNLIPFMVEALKFSTELTADVMAYSLVGQLKRGDASSKLKKGDTHFSQWFSALTRFIATFYCRFPATEITALLHYLLQCMADSGDSLDLLVLKELLGIMGGCETLLEVSSAQLEGLSGGKALRAEVMQRSPGSSGGLVISPDKQRRATQLLRQELIRSQTAIPLLLLTAQVRSRLLFDCEKTQLKLISHLFDTAQDVLVQFTDFLVSEAQELRPVAQSMPSLATLLGDVGLSVPVAFQLVRPFMRAALKHGVDPAAAPHYLQSWHPFSETMRAAIQQHVGPPALWETLSPRFFLLFWSMSLYDIRVPKSRYEQEQRRLKARYSELENKRTNSTALSLKMNKSDFGRWDRQINLEMRRLMQRVTNLTNEAAEQKKFVAQMREILSSEHGDFLRAVGPDTVANLLAAAQADTLQSSSEEVTAAARNSGCFASYAAEDVVAMAVMQHLVHPRILMSPVDAAYCVHFFLLLQSLQTPLFSPLRCFDRTFRGIASLVYCTTEAEASFIGYAFSELLQVLNRWDGSKEAFEKEAQSSNVFRDFKARITKSAPAGSAVTDVKAEEAAEAETIQKGGDIMEEEDGVAASGAATDAGEKPVKKDVEGSGDGKAAGDKMDATNDGEAPGGAPVDSSSSSEDNGVMSHERFREHYQVCTLLHLTLSGACGAPHQSVHHLRCLNTLVFVINANVRSVEFLECKRMKP